MSAKRNQQRKADRSDKNRAGGRSHTPHPPHSLPAHPLTSPNPAAAAAAGALPLHALTDPNAITPASQAFANLHTALDCKVLVLNRLYVPVRIVNARRAFTLLCKQLAEVISIDDGSYANYDFATWAELSQARRQFEPEKHDWVRTVRFDIAVPRVIRLYGYDKLPAATVKLNRRNLFARDRNLCQYCGQHFPTNELSIDHVIPRSQNGPDSWENLVCACVKCNARKGGRTPDQARMKLVREPRMPKHNPLISIRLGQDRYQSWRAFLSDAYWNVELK